MTTCWPRTLLTLLCVLAFVSMAHAECAWVLWEFKEEYWRKADVLDRAWTILRVHDSHNECRTDQAKLCRLRP